jgi:hypothetical protein
MITKKDTQWGMESWFLTRRRWLLPLLPEGLLPYTKFDFGMSVIGAWKNSNVYINDECYGPAIDIWVAMGIKHNGKLYGLVRTMFNNNFSYIEPILSFR